MEQVTYDDIVKSHDHETLSRMKWYQALRRALDEVTNQISYEDESVTIAFLLEALRDMSATTRLGDTCDRCGGVAWPHKLDREGDSMLAFYRHDCGHTWTCNWGMMVYELGF